MKVKFNEDFCRRDGSRFLIFSFCLWFLLLFAGTGEAGQFGDFQYVETNSNIIITGFADRTGDMVVPDNIDGHPVVSIADFNCLAWYRFNSVTLPNTITNIGKNVFSRSQIASVHLPENLVRIGPSAFSHCTNLTTLFIPGSVAELGEEAFGDCTNLRGVSFGNGILRIDKNTFPGCTKLGRVDLPETVRTIGDSAFSGCDVLTHVIIPASVTNIEDSAFGCTLLKGVYFMGNAPTLAGSHVFFNAYFSTVYRLDNATGWNSTFGGRPVMPWLQQAPYSYLVTTQSTVTITAYTGRESEVVVPATMNGLPVTALQACAFSGSLELESITLPSTITNLGDHVFSDCIRLKHVSLPNRLTNFSDSTFWDAQRSNNARFQIVSLASDNGRFMGVPGLRTSLSPRI